MSDFKPSSLKVAELRAELGKRGLSAKGKKDELVARLTEALETAKKSSESTEPEIQEPAATQASVEQEQISKEKSINADQTSNTVEVTVESTTVVEQSAEAVIEKPAEPLIKKPTEQLVEKPLEQLVEKPLEQLVEKPTEQLIERSAENVVEVSTTEQFLDNANNEQVAKKPQQQVIEEPQEQLVEKPQEQLIKKPQEQLVEKSQEQVIKKPQEQVIKKPQEQVIQKPQEQVIEAPAKDMDIDTESGVKRKRLESDAKEDDKRLKTSEIKEDAGDMTAIYVKGFIRPLIIKHVQELFGKYGTVKRFWMDSIKTHCYVTYETRLQAKEAFANVNDIKFPADTGRILTVGELTSEQADRLIEYEQNAAEKRIKVDWEAMISKAKAGAALSSSGSPSTDEGPRRFRAIGIGQITKQLAQAAEPTISPTASKSPLANTAPREISLDDLFRKTKALPQLYYLPNTDQEAKMKLEKLGH